MGAFRLLRFLRMARLLLAQDALLPPDFNERAPLGLRFLRAFLTFGAPRFDAQIRGRALSDRIRKLGPTYIKLGQFLATRPDIIGLQMAADLQHLQDRLPAFAEADVRRIIASDLDEPEKVFENMGPALAAASIAQVHQAHKTGAPDTKLAVKILRPRIDRKVARDLATFRVIARWIEKLMPTARRLRPVDAIDTLARSLEAETDLRREAAALEEMAYNARNDEGFCVPDVVWEGTGRRVLTMGWVDGIPASDVDALRIEGEPAGTRTLLPIVARAGSESQAGRDVDRAFEIGADGLGLHRTALQVIPCVEQIGGKIGAERNIEILRKVDRRHANFAEKFFLEIHRTAEQRDGPEISRESQLLAEGLAIYDIVVLTEGIGIADVEIVAIEPFECAIGGG